MGTTNPVYRFRKNQPQTAGSYWYRAGPGKPEECVAVSESKGQLLACLKGREIPVEKLAGEWAGPMPRASTVSFQMVDAQLCEPSLSTDSTGAKPWEGEGSLPQLPTAESGLVELICHPVSAAERKRLKELTLLSETGVLTEAERMEYGHLAERFEVATTKRITALGKLAELRGLPVRSLMQELGIGKYGEHFRADTEVSPTIPVNCQHHALSPGQTNAILTGLRLVQQEKFSPANPLMSVLTNEGKEAPLTEEEIEELCQHINLLGLWTASPLQ